MIPICVLKVGGSLFQHPWLPTALTNWSREHEHCSFVAICGGGVWADEIRRIDAKGGLTVADAHWSAIRTMSWSSVWLSQQVSPSIHSDSLEEMHAIRLNEKRSTIVFFDPFFWLTDIEPYLPEPKLPIGWGTTSDSIAARLARTMGAKLVMLKSAPFAYCSIEEAAASGYVDDSFASMVSPDMSVRFVNFPEWYRQSQLRGESRSPAGRPT